MNKEHKKLLKFLDKFKGFQWYGNDRATKKAVNKLVARNFCIKRKTILDNGYIFREVKRAQKGKNENKRNKKKCSMDSRRNTQL